MKNIKITKLKKEINYLKDKDIKKVEDVKFGVIAKCLKMNDRSMVKLIAKYLKTGIN